VVSIWNGTYVYIQKSSNYAFQRKSFSQQEHRPLIKPFIGVASNGYIIDVFGPYTANTSDTKIMEQLLEAGGPLVSFFQRGDVFLVDRGFRDVVPKLEALGYNVKMP